MVAIVITSDEDAIALLGPEYIRARILLALIGVRYQSINKVTLPPQKTNNLYLHLRLELPGRPKHTGSNPVRQIVRHQSQYW